MPLEEGEYVADLIATNPTGSDTKQFGDDHIRLIKRALLNTFPTANSSIRLQSRRIERITVDTVLTLETESSTQIITGAGDITVTLPEDAPEGWFVFLRYGKAEGLVNVIVFDDITEAFESAGLQADLFDQEKIVLKYFYEELGFLKLSAGNWAVLTSAVLGVLARPWQPSGSILLSQILLSDQDPVATEIPDGTMYLKYDDS